MSHPHMNLRGQDSTSMIDVKKRAAQYAKIASFVNADPDEIGKTLANTISGDVPTTQETLVEIITLLISLTIKHLGLQQLVCYEL